MEEGNTIVDVGSAAEAVSAEDDASAPLHQIESLCMRCGENGVTRLLLTRIPHFREVVLMAFDCPHCNERNNEVQFAGELQPRGCCYRLNVPPGDAKALNRQVVKSDSATIKVPEIEFEIPPEAQRGTLSTVEGILLRAADELMVLQEERKKVDPEMAEALDRFLVKLRSFAAGDAPFTFILDDPAGNSFIENPFAPFMDPSLTVKYYERTPEQQTSLGFLVDTSSVGGETEAETGNEALTEGRHIPDPLIGEPHSSVGSVARHRAIAHGKSEEVAAILSKYSSPEEVMTFPATCGACGISCETRMAITHIPHFQEVIVMASSCESCGYRSSELKPGGPIPEKAKRITLHVQNILDLSRDVIKSDSASVRVPELDLELASGTLGGIVTTVEGLIAKISGNLERVHGFTFGDSLDEWKRNKWQDFKSRLLTLQKVEEPWTLIIDDSLASSFVQPVTDVIEDDHQLLFEEYERSWEQNEELGLNDMDTRSADVAYNSTPSNV